MSSHNSAISSRTDLEPCGEFAVTIHRYRSRAVVLYPLAHSLQREPTKPLYDSSWRTWGLSFSKSPIIFCRLHQRIHLSLVSRISLLTGCDAIFAYYIFFFLGVVVCLSHLFFRVFFLGQ